ncbi:hypothetical protein [Enteractinococcus fodinae]|uniref:PIN domain-containing protein n=1 Tax=Enteractinococcus fodinae TaxID=684663 RepID=A0ABU2B0M0_9MICC|nr:hypothetical protein [Enteractinococcus fodinae]MDR7346961.1 hypothetical protein [Enteractinococcus fodinae]
MTIWLMQGCRPGRHGGLERLDRARSGPDIDGNPIGARVLGALGKCWPTGVPIDDAVADANRVPHTGNEDRAFEVQMLLADRGQHRAPLIPDLLSAAVAEKAGLTGLAGDKDFDLIAEITGQPVETLALLPD